VEAVVCTYCGRPVRETIHRRNGYSVDYYLMRTGVTAEVSLRGNEEDEEVFTYRRLVKPEEVITCSQCYQKPAVRQDLESWGEVRVRSI